MNDNNIGSEPELLTDWVLKQQAERFPGNGTVPYFERLTSVAKYLNNEVHPHVEKGALMQGDGYLTDHGPGHIDTVIRRASWLLYHPQETYPQFTPYEVYLLILAIHFHDVGNIFGREEHEKRSEDVMRKLGDLVGQETVERQAISKIARAHGGQVNGSKDTIELLPEKDPVLGHDVRYRALAAILRFADELADDCFRASRFVEALSLIPKNSEVYHAYARSLHSVSIRPKENRIDLRFSFFKDDAIRTFEKKRDDGSVENVYLLDEIYARTLKMHFERQYCMRFTQGIVRIEAIDVRIEVYPDKDSMMPCTDPIGYRLEERGYPDTSSVKITDICPNADMAGCMLKNKLEMSD